jgi:hypothetical protein
LFKVEVLMKLFYFILIKSKWTLYGKKINLLIYSMKNIKIATLFIHLFFSASFLYHNGTPSWLGFYYIILLGPGLDWVEPNIYLISSIALLICWELVGPLVKSIKIFWIFWILYRFTNNLWISFYAYYNWRDIARYYSLILL